MNSGSMKRLLTIAAPIEVVTGVALLTVPSWVGRLLLGEELTGMAVTRARVTGIALISVLTVLLAREQQTTSRQTKSQWPMQLDRECLE